jgi:hypothetical protein
MHLLQFCIFYFNPSDPTKEEITDDRYIFYYHATKGTSGSTEMDMNDQIRDVGVYQAIIQFQRYECL